MSTVHERPTHIDNANQLKYGQAVAGRTTFAYDATGSQRIEQPPTGNRTTTTWNYENQPTQYLLPAGSPVTMSYNSANRRVISQQGATSTKFVWDSPIDAYLSELDGANAVQAVYTNERQRYGSIVSQRRSSTSHWLHADALGTTRLLTGSTQTTTDTYLYDAWGNLIVSSGTTVNPFLWVGRYGYYQDASTGMVYVRARMYQPTEARWLSVDPLGFVDGPNVFRSFAGNPANTDPSGTKVLIAAWEGTGAKVGISDAMMATHYVPNAISFLRGRGVPAEQLMIGGQHVFPVATPGLDVIDAYTIANAAKTAECECCYPRLILIGFSYGAQTALDVAALLGPLGVRPSLLFTIDPVDKLDAYNIIPQPEGETEQQITSNWCRATNIYQRSATGGIGFVGNYLIGANNFKIGPDDLDSKPVMPGGEKYPRNSSQHHNLIPYLEKVHNKWLADLSYYSSITGVSRDSPTMCGVTDVCWSCGLPGF